MGNTSENGKARVRRYGLTNKAKVCKDRYRSSEKGKATERAYATSERGKALGREKTARYRATEKGKAWAEKFKTPKKIYDRNRYLANRGDIIKAAKDYYELNKAKVIAASIKWAKENSQKVAIYQKKLRLSEKGRLSRQRERTSPAGKLRQKRYLASAKGKESRARIKSYRRGARSTMTAQEWRQNKQYFDNACAYCGRADMKLTRDHFVPILHKEKEKRVVAYDQNGFVPACMPCQLRKCNRDPYEFLKSISAPAALVCKVLLWIKSGRVKNLVGDL